MVVMMAAACVVQDHTGNAHTSVRVA
jgi:hypothetical protein